MIILKAQDGAMCHTTQHVLQALRDHFKVVLGNRTVGDEQSTWSPRSPDLAPNDYWLWGSLLQKINTPSNPRPANLEILRESIRQAVHSVTLEEVRAALDIWRGRLRKCVDNEGHLFEYND